MKFFKTEDSLILKQQRQKEFSGMRPGMNNIICNQTAIQEVSLQIVHICFTNE
jgi:hypothetical protein